MKVKTSVTLSEDILSALARLAPHAKNRSDLIEKALRHYIASFKNRMRDERDRKILATHSKTLNAQALDVLEYQDEAT